MAKGNIKTGESTTLLLTWIMCALQALCWEVKKQHGNEKESKSSRVVLCLFKHKGPIPYSENFKVVVEQTCLFGAYPSAYPSLGMDVFGLGESSLEESRKQDQSLCLGPTLDHTVLHKSLDFLHMAITNCTEAPTRSSHSSSSHQCFFLFENQSIQKSTMYCSWRTKDLISQMCRRLLVMKQLTKKKERASLLMYKLY